MLLFLGFSTSARYATIIGEKKKKRNLRNLRNLFLKQNIFLLDFSSIRLYKCFFLILPNRPLCARNKVKCRCLIKDVRTAFRVIISAI